LFGPLGSMVPANEGMRAEMKQVFVAYFVMVLSFSVQLCSVFWLTMPLTPSIICTICFAGFSRNWYKYCVRIYNRFQFANMWKKNQDEANEMGDVNNVGTFVDADDPLQQLQTKEFEMYERKKKLKEEEARKQEEAAANASSSSGLGAKMMHMMKGSNVPPLASQEEGNGDNTQQDAEEGRAVAPAAAAAAVIMSKEEFKKIVSFRRLEANKLKPNTVIKEGYMSKKGEKGIFGGEAPWNRRFFVLYQGGDLKYFKTKELSRDPKSALKELPIQIENYRVLTKLEPKSAAAGGNGLGLGETQTRARSDSTETDATVSSAVEGSKGWGKSMFGGQASATSSVKTPSVEGFFVYLMPVREMLGDSFDKHRVWAFRCDTQKEQREWLDKLVDLSAKPILSNQAEEAAFRSI